MKRFVFLTAITLLACSSEPDREQAAVWLTAPESWILNEVTVNGQPVYRNGKIIEQFGTVSFSRYMKSVRFNPDGTFEGNFDGDSRVYRFQWVAEDHQVVVSDTVPNSGQWVIPYRTLLSNSFEMETETSAMDPPNLTRIRLRFGL